MDLVSQADSGDEAALVRLLERCAQQQRDETRQRIPAEFRSLLSAEDVLQQTCVDVLQSFASTNLDNDDAFTAWFRQIARRNIIDAVRALRSQKRGGQARRIELTNPEQSLVDLVGALLVTSVTASRQHLQQEAFQNLQSAVEQLPRHYRQVVKRYDLEQCSIETVAAELQRSVGAVFMIRSRAHRILADLLGSSLS